jgi:hypothetical protein
LALTARRSASKFVLSPILRLTVEVSYIDDIHIRFIFRKLRTIENSVFADGPRKIKRPSAHL